MGVRTSKPPDRGMAAEVGGNGIPGAAPAGNRDACGSGHGPAPAAQPSRAAASRVNAGIGMPCGQASRQGVPSQERHAPAPAPSAA